MTGLCGGWARNSRRCGKAVRRTIARCLSRGIPTGSHPPTWPFSMRVDDLDEQRVAIWGLGREGRAAIDFLRKQHPALPLVLLDDAVDRRSPEGIGGDVECVFGAERIGRAIESVDVIVKSPGVSLYRSELRRAREKGIRVTSLLNLWFAKRHHLTTICVTGTKGKSTTASLIAHILTKLGRRV